MFIVQSYSVFKVKITELKSSEISVWPVSSEPLNLFTFTRCGGVSVITVQTDLERDSVAFNISQSQDGSDLQRKFAPHKSHNTFLQPDVVCWLPSLFVCKNNMPQSQGGSESDRQGKFASRKSHILGIAQASAARRGMLTAILCLFAETQLHTEIYTCWTHKGAVIGQVQSQWRVAGQFM